MRAVGASHLRRRYRKPLRLRRRVVTQQKFFHRLPCATGQGAMKCPQSRAAARHVTAAPPAARRFGGYSIANASGRCVAPSEASAHVSGSTRLPVRGAPPSPEALARMPRGMAVTDASGLFFNGLLRPRGSFQRVFSATGSWLILAAMMKSLSERPPIACVQSSIATLRYPARCRSGW